MDPLIRWGSKSTLQNATVYPAERYVIPEDVFQVLLKIDIRGNLIYLIIEFAKERIYKDAMLLDFNGNGNGNILNITWLSFAIAIKPSSEGF